MSTNTDDSRYDPLIASFSGARIGVLGDLAADVYVAGYTERVSREAPVLILRYERKWTVAGCAANTAANVRALGASVQLVGLLGEDEPGRDLRRQVAENDIGLEGLVLSSQIDTVTKTRFLAGGRNTTRQQVLRVDHEPPEPPPEPLRIVLRKRVEELDDRVDAWIVSDYGYRTIDDAMKKRLGEIASRKPVIVDSRYDLLSYGPVTVIKPNEDEAIAATTATDGSIPQMRQAASELIERLGVKAVLLTLGSQGMLLHERSGDPILIPAEGTDEIVDLTGAGDTVAAIFTVATASGANFQDAARLANCAAGIVVMKEGAATVSPHELRAALAPAAQPRT